MTPFNNLTTPRSPHATSTSAVLGPKSFNSCLRYESGLTLELSCPKRCTTFNHDNYRREGQLERLVSPPLVAVWSLAMLLSWCNLQAA